MNPDTTEGSCDWSSRQFNRDPLDNDVKDPSSAPAYSEVGEKPRGFSSDASKDLSGERDDFSVDSEDYSHVKNKFISNDCRSNSDHGESKVGFLDRKEAHKNMVKSSKINNDTALSNFEMSFEDEGLNNSDKRAYESISSTVNSCEKLRGVGLRNNFLCDDIDTAPVEISSKLEVSSVDKQDSSARSVSNDSAEPRRMCEFFMSRKNVKKTSLDSEEIPSFGEIDAETNSPNCEVLEMAGDTLFGNWTVICEASILEECEGTIDNRDENIDTCESSIADAGSQGLFSALGNSEVSMDDSISNQLIESCVADVEKCNSGHFETDREAKASKDDSTEANFCEVDEETGRKFEEISSTDIERMLGCFVSEDLIEVVAQSLDRHYGLLGVEVANEVHLRGDSEENQSELVNVGEKVSHAFVERKAGDRELESLMGREECIGGSSLEMTTKRVPAEFSTQNERSRKHLQGKMEEDRENSICSEKGYKGRSRAMVVSSSELESLFKQSDTEVVNEEEKDKAFDNSVGGSATNHVIVDVGEKTSQRRNKFKGDLDIHLGDNRIVARHKGKRASKTAENRDFQQECNSIILEKNSKRNSKLKDNRNKINGTDNLDNKEPIGYMEGGGFKTHDYYGSQELRDEQYLKKGSFARRERVLDKRETVRTKVSIKEGNGLKDETCHKGTNLDFQQQTQYKRSRFLQHSNRGSSDPIHADNYKSPSERLYSHSNPQCPFKETSYERYCKFLTLLDNAYCYQVHWLRFHEAEVQRRKTEHAYRSWYRSYMQYWY